MNNPVARIMDANLNRAGEALRTMEEYARFVMDSRVLSRRAKILRHRLVEAGLAWTGAHSPADAPVANRDIAGDVGASIKTEGEGRRENALAVAAAAARRAAEALRVLSEYAKVDSPELGGEFEKLRYAVYDLEPVLLAGTDLRRRLERARLYVIVTSCFSSTDPLTVAREACEGGADVIQLREKEMEDLEFHRLASDMADICRERGAIFLINDRPHIAGLVDASGVHGGQGDLPVALLRRLLGPERIVGRSTSGPDSAMRALADGADYIGVGPVFETDTKKHRAATGLEYVAWAAKWRELPYFAVGGINRSTLDDALAAGADAVAICSGITMARDIAAETGYFKARLTERQGTARHG